MLNIQNGRFHLPVGLIDRIVGSRGGAEERREHPRVVTMLRVGLLHTASAKELCVVRNLSAGGLSARVFRSFSIHERVSIELLCEERLDGTVQWARNNEIGVEFDTEIDVERVLASRWTTEDGRPYRLPRIDIGCRCRLRVGSRFYCATLANISQGGVMLTTQRPFEGGLDAIVTLPGLGSLESSVRWSRNDHVGLAFNERLPFELLAAWIQKHRREHNQPNKAALDPPAVSRN